MLANRRQLRELALRLLYVVFAELGQAGADRRRDPLGALPLPDADERDIRRVASIAARLLVDLAPQRCVPLADRPSTPLGMAQGERWTETARASVRLPGRVAQ